MIPSGTDAVIFDLDGVLWDTSSHHERAYAEVFRAHGLPVVPYTALAGRRTDEVFAEMVAAVTAAHPAARPRLDVAALTLAKRAAARRLLTAEPPDVTAAREVITALEPRVALGLASSASRSTVETFLALLGLEGALRCAWSGEDVAHGKPAPDLFLAAIHSLSAKHPLVVEDAPAGVTAAVAAGARVIAVRGTAHDDELLAAGASEVVDSIRELL